MSPNRHYQARRVFRDAAGEEFGSEAAVTAMQIAAAWLLALALGGLVAFL